jgi:hypothetical protein
MVRAIEKLPAAGANTPSGVQQAVDSVAYDAWGNVRASVNPLRFHTVYRKDSSGATR